MFDTQREKKLLLNFINRSLTPQKFGNLSTFPSSSFDFPALFHFQELDALIADFGSIYSDLIRAFYANLSIGKCCFISSTVKGKKILLTMEEFGKCLEVPYVGERIFHGYTID